MIAHVDADAFFASVLVRKDPKLRGKPLLALGMGGGCVIAASYEAKAKGIKTGMRVTDALKLCPDALRINSDFRETGLASDQIESILSDQCPLIEQYSVDEWFLDLRSMVGGVPPDCQAWGEALRKDILRRTGLSVSAGIGPSKLLAKMASEYRKPGGVTFVNGGGGHAGRAVVETPHAASLRAVAHHTANVLDIQTFLRDRPAAAIPGIGHRRVLHADRMEWNTAWDIACAPDHQLRELFGRPGVDLKRELNGEILSPVVVDSGPPKSISRARSFRPINDRSYVWAHVLRHLEYTVLKMRRQDLATRGVSIWLRDSEYDWASSHASLPQFLNTEEAIKPYIERCFNDLWKPRLRVTQTGLCLWRLEEQISTQFSLFEAPELTLEKESLQESLDDIHERFGRDAVTRGSALDVKSGTKRGFDLTTISAD